jgi:hypothetical protein
MSDTVSPEQLAANRANAASSTGPTTTEGKLRSSQNARKHGFTASSFAVVRLEDLDEVAHLREDLVNLYQPANSQELFAVERIALAQQAILRAARLEAGYFSLCLGESFDTSGQFRMPMNSQFTADIEVSQAQNRNYLLGDGFHRLIRQNNSFALLLRYQAQAERQYRRAIEEFERLKALREELRNEPNLAESETNETTCTSCETNPIPGPQPLAPGPLATDPPPPAPGPRPPAPTRTSCETNPIPSECPAPAPDPSAPAPGPRSPAPALDYHIELQPLEPIPGGPPCIEC